MRRRFLRAHIIEQLHQHIAKPRHRADRQAVRFSGQRWQGMIGAKNIARPVNEIEVIILAQFFTLFRACHAMLPSNLLPKCKTGWAIGKATKSICRFIPQFINEFINATDTNRKGRFGQWYAGEMHERR